MARAEPTGHGAPVRTRSYGSAADLRRDLALLAGEWRAVSSLRGHPVVTPELRERLMLVVTSVNECRYCARFHAGLARAAGLGTDEIAGLLDGDLARAPEDQRAALVYALEWAEADGRPAPACREALASRYGEETSRAIDAALRAIRIGNLLGNTWDRLLCRLTRGRVGCPAPAPPGATPRPGVIA